MKRTFLLCACALSFLLAACSSSSSTPPASTAESACDAYTTARASYGERCRTTSRGADDGAKGRLAKVCQSTLSLPGLGIAVADVQSCAAALKTAGCDQSESTLDACKPLRQPKGTLAEGTACASSAQCASGKCKGGDIDNDGVRCGTCVATAAVGAPCTLSSSNCAPRTYCVHGAGDAEDRGTCKGRAKEGEACSFTDGSICDDGLYCPESGKCTKKLGANAACDGFGACAGALECSGGTCQVRLALGAACTESDSCDIRGECIDGKCSERVYAKVGEDCTKTTCAPDAACRNGVCVARKAEGASCDAKADACVEQTGCINGKCALPDPSVCK